MIAAAHAPLIASSRYLGSAEHQRNDAYVVVGQDGGQSIPLRQGTLFLFSDTLLVPTNPSVPRVSAAGAAVRPLPGGAQSVFRANCAGISSGSDLQQALASVRYLHDAQGLPREIVTATERERFRQLRFWPGHGVLVNGQVYFYYLGIQTTDPASVWGFRNIGAGIATLDPASGECIRIQTRGDWRYWSSGEDLHVGVQVLMQDGLVYLFGSIRQGLDRTAWLARVPADRIADKDAYTYLASTRPTWAAGFEQACSLGSCAADFSVSYNAFLERYTLIYVDEYRKRLMLRLAEQLWGPYTSPIDLIGVPHDPASTLVYLGFEHADFQRQGGRTIFVSYCEPHFASNSLVSLTFDRSAD